MKEPRLPKYTDGQKVKWDRGDETVDCQIHQWWRCKWPNGSSGYERIGYNLVEYPETWAWEEEILPVGEEAQ